MPLGNTVAFGTISTNAAAAIKKAPGTVWGWHLDNTANSVATYFQFLDATAPTVGSTAPLMSIAIPAGGAANIAWPIGVTFLNAIQIAATTTATGSTAPTSPVTYNVVFQ